MNEEKTPEPVPQLPVYQRPEIAKPGILSKMLKQMTKLPKVRVKAPTPKRRKKGDNLFY